LLLCHRTQDTLGQLLFAEVGALATFATRAPMINLPVGRLMPEGVRTMRSLRCLRYALDELYDQYNQREFVHPDPLELLYEYETARDREIVALLAGSMAFGRVSQILASLRALLGRMGPSPADFLERTPPADLPEIFVGFKHRWTTGLEVARVLSGVRRIIENCGSLGRCFAAGLQKDDITTLPALGRFVDQLRTTRPEQRNSLLPDVSGTGACKRLHLMLRWLVRRDAVDPGGWVDVNPRLLIIPLDTHMHRVGTALGLCRRKQADRRSALEITAAFAAIQPADPVRYDFALTRLGIRAELDLPAFLAQCRRIQRPGGNLSISK
jgi:uncharacterized protein (TIGR02757 family)